MIRKSIQLTPYHSFEMKPVEIWQLDGGTLAHCYAQQGKGFSIFMLEDIHQPRGLVFYTSILDLLVRLFIYFNPTLLKGIEAGIH